MSQAWKQQLAQLIEKNAAFAVFKSAGEPLRGFASRELPSALGSFVLKEGFHMMPFVASEQSPYYIISPDFVSADIGFADVDAIPGFANSKHSAPEPMSKSVYASRLGQGIDMLHKGVARKFVFSRAFVHPSVKNEVPSIFMRLLNARPNAFVFLVNHPLYGMWMGATPETFLRAGNGILKTQALAGTRRTGTPGEWGKKELEEQAYVSAHIREMLSKADVAFNESGPHTTVAGPVEHLLTRFEITTFNRASVEALASSLHPTPAVCGTPTREAMSLIGELEPIPRSYYTGFVGPVFSPGDFELYVNLRSMQVFSNALALRLGGGITKDSVIEHEWEETLLKAQTLLGVLK